MASAPKTIAALRRVITTLDTILDTSQASHLTDRHRQELTEIRQRYTERIAHLKDIAMAKKAAKTFRATLIRQIYEEDGCTVRLEAVDRLYYQALAAIPSFNDNYVRAIHTKLQTFRSDSYVQEEQVSIQETHHSQ